MSKCILYKFLQTHFKCLLCFKAYCVNIMGRNFAFPSTQRSFISISHFCIFTKLKQFYFYCPIFTGTVKLTILLHLITRKLGGSSSREEHVFSQILSVALELVWKFNVGLINRSQNGEATTTGVPHFYRHNALSRPLAQREHTGTLWEATWTF